MNIFKICVKDYNCLKDFTLEIDLNKEKGISPLVLVGLNGTGKSSLLEAISEHLNNCYLIEKGKTIKNSEVPDNIIHYQLGEAEFIELSKNKVNAHMDGEYPASFNLSKIIEDKDSSLPEYLVAYSSGLNNSTLDKKFTDITSYYYDELKKTNRNPDEPQEINLRKGLFIDYKLNWSLFISLFLFKKKEIKELFELIDEINVENIESFIIEWTPPNFELPYEMQEFMNVLAINSSGHSVIKIGKKKSTYGYLFEGDFIESLKKDFEKIGINTALELFKLLEAFYLLSDVEKENNFKIFDIKIKDKNIKKAINYENLSDGQHQLIHILGILLMFKDTNSLILLDEPDTHLNPSLRSNFISLVNKIMCSEEECHDENVKSPQVIISTHSPFIIGDTPKENIREFKINPETNTAYAEPINWQTYGASYSLILSKIFELESGISKFAEEEIKELIETGKKEDIEQKLDEYGQSILLTRLYDKFYELEK